MSRLRVLHLIGGGDTGGAMTHLLPLMSALEKQDCDVQLACLGPGGLAEEATRRGIPVSVLPMDGPWDVSILRPLRRLVGGGPTRWDVLHSHGMRANVPLRLVVLGRRHRPCVFTTVHSDLRQDYASVHLSRLYAGLDRATLSNVDTVICVSEALRALLVERGYPADRIVTIRSGIELSSHNTAPVTGALTAGYGTRPPDDGTADGRLRVGVVARLVPVKDIALLLEVMALLRRTVPEVEAIVVGDGPERASLEEQSRSLGLDESVRFAGRLADIHPVLGEIDVYLVTSVFEGGMSMSVLEAMAAGLPVVTTAAGGVVEAVADMETGFVVSRDQERGALASALAERAAALLTDPDLRTRMGAAGAKRVRARFLVEHTATATLRAYRRCLAARGGA